MSVILTWYSDGDIIEEPFANTAQTTYTFTLTNSGDSTAKECAFFLKKASITGDEDNPSSKGILQDWYDVLTWGETSGEGLRLIQSSSDTEFKFGQGDNVNTAIPLTIGTGTDGDQIAAGASVTISLKLVPPSSESTRRLYIELEVTYTT